MPLRIVQTLLGHVLLALLKRHLTVYYVYDVWQ